MSETGATPDQVEAANARLMENNGWADADADTVELSRKTFASLAQWLVPPGSRIVDAEDIAAVRRVVTECRKRNGNFPAGRPSRDDIDRLAALVEGS